MLNLFYIYIYKIESESINNYCIINLACPCLKLTEINVHLSSYYNSTVLIYVYVIYSYKYFVL